MFTLVTFKKACESFIKSKRMEGLVYSKPQEHVNLLYRYIQENYPNKFEFDEPFVMSFINKYKGQRGGLYNKASTIRELGRFFICRGFSNIFVLPTKLTPKFLAKKPYFFTKEEIKIYFKYLQDLIATAKYRHDKFKYIVFHAYITSLYCCGLRPNEARNLLRSNMNLNSSEPFFDVLCSKGPYSRRVFISDQLRNFLKDVDDKLESFVQNRDHFFSTCKGKCYYKSFFSVTLKDTWSKVFPNSKDKPLLYAFRHNFACHHINEASLSPSKEKVRLLLPYLSRYMGHQCIKHTLYYFHFVSEFFTDYLDVASTTESLLPEVDDYDAI